MKQEELVALVLKTHETLCCESDLSPHNPRINDTLGLLVENITAGRASGDVGGVLGHPAIRAVQGELLGRLALAESKMESHWSNLLCARAGLAVGDLKVFRYWNCYRDLVAGELRNLLPFLRSGERHTIAFVGAGALPLSAILMHTQIDADVVCIDADPHACRMASALCTRLGLAGITVRCAEGVEWDYARSSVVFIASLVSGKAEVAARVRQTAPRALIALRSAEGLCTLLYEAVNEVELEAMGCGLVARTGAIPHVVNTTLLYEGSSVA
jgi:nicotianamine synthase-like protein